jgi:hypothetical protein
MSDCPTPTKTAHRTKNGARKEARSIVRRKGGSIYIYACSCGAYHTTSRIGGPRPTA